jgi:Ni,Fe-hydrogenase I cytochrome b subunit
MHSNSRRLAGVLLLVYPSVLGGGSFLLNQLASPSSGYAANHLRQDFFRAGHAHAGVLLVLSLLLLRYVDETNYAEGTKVLLRNAVPCAAILMPLGFFLSVATPDVVAPNDLVYLVPIGGLVMALGLLAIGVGLLRAQPQVSSAPVVHAEPHSPH